MTQGESDEKTIECPTCGRTGFASEQGMKSHHARSHGESIAGIEKTCDQCGEQFRAAANRPDARLCSTDCRGDWMSENDQISGKDNPRWSGEDVTIQCEQCDEEFQVRPYEADDRTYCSEDCMSKAYQNQFSGGNQPEYLSKGNLSGENHPSWKESVSRECDQCGETFETAPSENQRFCTQDCYGEWLSENRSGEDSWNWESGETTLECERCGSEFSVTNAREDEATYCSRNCHLKALNGTGEDSPAWRGGDVTLECKQCGDEFNVKPSEVEHREHCSRECMAESYQEVTGQDHPLWRGGKSVYDAVKRLLSQSSWEQISNQHRQNESECRMCGTSENLETHHIVPVLSGGTNEDWNLMTLCDSCHRKSELYIRDFIPPVLIGNHNAE